MEIKGNYKITTKIHTRQRQKLFKRYKDRIGRHHRKEGEVLVEAAHLNVHLDKKMQDCRNYRCV